MALGIGIDEGSLNQGATVGVIKISASLSDIFRPGKVHYRAAY